SVPQAREKNPAKPLTPRGAEAGRHHLKLYEVETAQGIGHRLQHERHSVKQMTAENDQPATAQHSVTLDQRDRDCDTRKRERNHDHLLKETLAKKIIADERVAAEDAENNTDGNREAG